ncbi:helix-turn-helix domain-containing protein [Streptomyces sp. NPDC005408]|uniref:helix-turn-helix transcriptional regulator n=1 Tax=Streptomyces sp. NPDC005408 TaxID=3155341 RepID=UPI0033A4038A
MDETPAPRTTWTFLTNHARVLSAVARDPWIRIRDLAKSLELTERTVQAVVSDLEAAGYLTHTREGRRNKYRLIGGQFRHPAEEQRDIAPLLKVLANPEAGPRAADDDVARPAGERRRSDAENSQDQAS